VRKPFRDAAVYLNVQVMACRHKVPPSQTQGFARVPAAFGGPAAVVAGSRSGGRVLGGGAIILASGGVFLVRWWSAVHKRFRDAVV
jgi:hypothetical protein